MCQLVSVKAWHRGRQDLIRAHADLYFEVCMNLDLGTFIDLVDARIPGINSFILSEYIVFQYLCHSLCILL